MLKVKIYNPEGKVVGEKELRADVFGVKVKPSVVHEVSISLASSARRSWAHTKTRGEVRGGGKKPWRQKGTGRARHGSIRSPIWVGGGVVGGPRSERDYSKKINKKMKRAALLMTLADKVAAERFILVEPFSVKDGKTKEMASLISRLPVSGKLTLVAPGKDELLARSCRNLKQAHLNRVEDLGLMDVLKADYLVMSPQAAERIEAEYGTG